jgi:hypothetical protein
VLESGDTALEAWQQWLSRVDIERLDAESTRLLPQLYLNLRTLGVEHPMISKLKGVYRHHWYRNRLLLPQLAMLVARLRELGVPVMLSNSAAVIASCHSQIGARTMDGAGIAVPTTAVRVATKLLTEAGWTPTQRTAAQLTDAYLQAADDHLFRNQAGLSINLQWRLLQQHAAMEAEDDLWNSAQAVRIEGAEVPSMNPTDLLLLLCVQSAARRGLPAACWVADAAAILRAGAVDWQRLVRLARQFERAQSAKERFEYLRSTFNLSIPAEVIASLGALPVSWRERLSLRLETQGGELSAAGYRMMCHIVGYRRLRRQNPTYARLDGFLVYLREAYNLQRNRQVILYLVRSIWNKLRRSPTAAASS